MQSLFQFGAALEQSARDLIQAAAAKGLTLALAESCTGGLVVGLLTQVPGSSAVLDRGFVTYSNQAKQDMLGVPLSVLEAHGAVSAAVALSMAEGALSHSRADLALAITGIAGPGGGSPQKPVGLVHFALALRGHPTQPVERHFGELGRTEVRWAALEQAMQMLHKGVSEKAGSG
ncbi:MAG: CinA family protein [Alphaproteobacteria bacterium]|nr:CinA family protein [Alphaproteobacteria bacterium]